MPLRVVPVIDLKGGLAVHARGGDRGSYRPLRTGPAGGGPGPLAVAKAFRDALGLTSVYVADLDAIAGAPPAAGLLEALQDDGFGVLADCGLRDRGSYEPLAALGLEAPIAGSETVGGASALRGLAGVPGLVFGLDLKGGRPLLASGAEWVACGPLELVTIAAEAGVERLLVLDIARVGNGEGVGNAPLLGAIRAEFPSLEVSVGGGVSGLDDLLKLEDAGVTAALVGSALHDGRLGRTDLQRFRA